MGLTSLQVCMDASDWLQGGGVNEEGGGMDSSASSGDIITCSSRPMLERRLRPPHDQALKCPRCDSTHTKFCYYNNYSLSQPRYFCKTCRRYWTKGGSLRNIPVGGGCRKNKRSSSSSVGVKKNSTTSSSSSHNATDLHLSFPELQLSHLTTLLGNNNHGDLGNQDFIENKINGILQTPNFIDNKFDSILGNPLRGGQDFMAANTDLGLVSSGLGDVSSHGGFTFSNSHNLCSPYGISLSGNGAGSLLDSCQRLQMLPFDGGHHHHHHRHHHEEDPTGVEVKPNKQLLSIDWQDQQGCSDVGKDSFGYFNTGIGSWTTAGVMNGYGSSATDPLV